jgi:hypothetical protein
LILQTESNILQNVLQEKNDIILNYFK